MAQYAHARYRAAQKKNSESSFLTEKGTQIWDSLVGFKNYMKDSVQSMLDYFELFPKDARIVFIGLDNAGKTTLMRMLKDNQVTAAVPTLHPQAQEFYIGNRKVYAHDMGGHETARALWKDYCCDLDAIFFLVDAADRTRLEEARSELDGIFELESLAHVPIAVIGNKIDKPTACSTEDLAYALELPIMMEEDPKGAYKYGRRHTGAPIALFMASVINRVGYKEAFTYMSDMLKQAKQQY